MSRVKLSTVAMAVCCITWTGFRIAEPLGDLIIVDLLILGIIGAWFGSCWCLVPETDYFNQEFRRGQMWCQGCDELIHSDWMKFTDDGRYRCDVCRGVTRSADDRFRVFSVFSVDDEREIGLADIRWSR